MADDPSWKLLIACGSQLPTATAPHQLEGLLSIDHIAVPSSWSVLGLEHRPAFVDGTRISDHDAYFIDVDWH